MMKYFFLILCFTSLSTSAQLISEPITGSATSGFFGKDVKLNEDGTIAVVSSPANWINPNLPNNPNLNTTGTVKVYEWTGTSWQQLGNTLLGSDGNLFGASVAVNDAGTRIFVGIPQEKSTTIVYSQPYEYPSGAVKVYDLVDNTWQQKGSAIYGNIDSQRYGYAIASNSSGNHFILGNGYRKVCSSSNNCNFKGEAKVFYWNGNDWQQKGNTIIGDINNELFGDSVAMSDNANTIAVGGTGWIGSARAYLWNGTSWQQKGNTLTGNSSVSKFGIDVNLSANGNILAVGAERTNLGPDRNGEVRVYEISNNHWIQVGQTFVGATYSEGYNVDVDGSGNLISIGSPSYTEFATSIYGKIAIYERSGNSWGLKGELFGGPNLTIGDYFSLAKDGSRLISGSPNKNVANSSIPGPQGQVQIFDLTPPNVQTQEINIQLNGNGLATIEAAEINNGSTAVDGVTSISLDKTTFNCENIGTNTVNLMVTSFAGITNSAPATVVVTDNVAPQFSNLPNIAVDTQENGEIVNYNMPSVSDNCYGSSVPFASYPPTPANFTRLGSLNGHTYFISNDANNWAGHQDFINNVQGAYPVSINSVEENEFITESINVNSVYIGLNDFQNETSFVWQNGDPVTYTNWLINQPNHEVDHDVVELQFTGFWNDVSPSLIRKIVIELPYGTQQTEGLPSGSNFPISIHKNTFQVIHASGNASSKSFNIEVIDNLDPIINCQEDINLSITNTEITVDYSFPTFSDNALDGNFDFSEGLDITGFTKIGNHNNHT